MFFCNSYDDITIPGTNSCTCYHMLDECYTIPPPLPNPFDPGRHPSCSSCWHMSGGRKFCSVKDLKIFLVDSFEAGTNLLHEEKPCLKPVKIALWQNQTASVLYCIVWHIVLKCLNIPKHWSERSLVYKLKIYAETYSSVLWVETSANKIPYLRTSKIPQIGTC